MKKVMIVMFLIIVVLCGCATPESLRQEGPAVTFNTVKGTPQEFSRCLVCQLDNKFVNSIVRDHPGGNATVLVKDNDQIETRIMFDIDKTMNGVNILVYFSSWDSEVSRQFGMDNRANYMFSVVEKSLNACGAKESRY